MESALKETHPKKNLSQHVKNYDNFHVCLRSISCWHTTRALFSAVNEWRRVLFLKHEKSASSCYSKNRKQNNDMEFLFSCSTRCLTRLLRSQVRYRVEGSNRNSISPRAHVFFSIYLIPFVLDKLFDSVDNKEVLIFIVVPNISCAKPTISVDCLCGGFWVV